MVPQGARDKTYNEALEAEPYTHGAQGGAVTQDKTDDRQDETDAERVETDGKRDRADAEQVEADDKRDRADAEQTEADDKQSDAAGEQDGAVSREAAAQRVGTHLGRWGVVEALLWLEMWLKLSTEGAWWPQVIYLAVFSYAIGLALTVLCNLPRGTKARRRLRGTVLALLCAAFATTYFVFKAFGVYYDLRTVVVGAHNVATGFGGDAAAIVLSPAGVAHLLVFLAPYLAWLVLPRLGVLEPKRPARDAFVFAAKQACGVGVLAVLLVGANATYAPVWGSQYSFALGVQDFGLAVNLPREVFLAGGGDAGTSLADAAAADAVPPTSVLSDIPTVYGFSTMDIDFAAKAASTDDRALVDMDNYCAAQRPSRQNAMTGVFRGKNLIFITAEAFCAEAVRPDTTPTLYRLANKGIQVPEFYQPAGAGTTGGETQYLLGVLAEAGGDSMQLAATHDNYFTMGSVLDRLGYNGWVFHNSDYDYYNRGTTHNALGYSHGYMGLGNGIERWVTEQWPESDVEMMRGTFDDLYGDAAPFNVYYMSVSGHCTDGTYAPTDTMAAPHWDAVADLPYSDEVKAYLATQVELGQAVEYLVGRLEETGQADDTVIVIGGDHYPYGLGYGQDDALAELYGHNADDAWQRDHNRLIIWSGCLEDESTYTDPIVVDGPMSSIDVLPTLLNLFGCEWDSRLLPGRDVFSGSDPLVYNPSYDWKTDLGTYRASTGTFTPAEGVTVPDGYVDEMNDVVKGKIAYSKAFLYNDYFKHLFG